MMDHQIRELENGCLEFTSYENFQFEGGGSINPLVLVYETYGKLNEKKDNAIVVHHSLSSSSHIAATQKNPEKGWWQDMVGPGKGLDSNRHFIICINNLGSCFGSSGPLSINPGTSMIYAMDFPDVTIIDMVRSQKILIEALGIEKLHAVLGGSMGAMLSTTWLSLYPEHSSHLISISSCAKAYPANRANRLIQKEMIKLDPAWNEGNYSVSGNLEGFKNARRLGLLTYRNWSEINERFIDKKGSGSIEHYLEYNAQKFARRFDCNSYLRLLDAMDSFDLSANGRELTEVFSPIKAKVLIVAVDSDVLFTPSQQQSLYEAMLKAGVEAHFTQHSSSYGHDAFLVETEAFDRYIRTFIQAQWSVSDLTYDS
jgi:homoserine O-acetyltransferase